MAMVSYSQLIFLITLIICCSSEGNGNRHRRQIVDGSNRNLGVPQQKLDGSIPLNNAPFNPSNNPNTVITNERNTQQQSNTNNQLLAASQPQTGPVRSGGYYNSPAFQPPPFTGEKPSGWFGTNHVNWVSNQQSELDKNKLAAAPNNPQVNVNQPRREDGGPFFLEKVAKQYASKGEKAFKFGEFETRQGRGAVCQNFGNFDGYVFGTFPCPLPPSTGMNQLDQFCCGPANYQYCCNNQEFSQTQRGAFSDPRFIGEQQFPKRSTYSSPAKKILAVILPIAGIIVFTGILILVFLYYKKIRKEQNRTRKPAGAIRLEDNYSIVPQDLSIEKTIPLQDE